MADKIGKALERKPEDPQQPRFDEVQKKDVETMNFAVDRLRSLIERIERLEEEKKGLAIDIKDIFAEAKSAGFDAKIMRTVIKLRKMDASDRDEQEYKLDAYRKALDV